MVQCTDSGLYWSIFWASLLGKSGRRRISCCSLRSSGRDAYLARFLGYATQSLNEELQFRALVSAKRTNKEGVASYHHKCSLFLLLENVDPTPFPITRGMLGHFCLLGGVTYTPEEHSWGREGGGRRGSLMRGHGVG